MYCSVGLASQILKTHLGEMANPNLAKDTDKANIQDCIIGHVKQQGVHQALEDSQHVCSIQ